MKSPIRALRNHIFRHGLGIELRQKGVKLRDETPRIGHGGARIAFLDPASTGNVLIELAELPKQPAAH